MRIREVSIQTSEIFEYDSQKYEKVLHVSSLNEANGFDDSTRKQNIYSYYDYIVNILKITFLPSCYPDSVRKEYLEYQLWDSLQAT
jgi:hypothetical protein